MWRRDNVESFFHLFFFFRPFGRSLAPMLSGAAQTSTMTPSSIISTPSTLNTNNTVSANNENPSSSIQGIQIIKWPQHFQTLLSTHRAVIINYTNEEGCPPCRMIAPEYKRLVEKYQNPSHFNNPRERNPNTLLIAGKIDTKNSSMRDILMREGITATPTFICYLDGKKVYGNYFF